MRRRHALAVAIGAIAIVIVIIAIAYSNILVQAKVQSSNPETGMPKMAEEQNLSSKFVSTVNNPFYSLVPGTTYTYETRTDNGTEKNIMIVTNETKKILGVTTVVVWDRVWLNNGLIEETYDWYAQDKDGNVWYFGEDSKTYENGQVASTEGSWQAGVDGARQGIIMEASPKVGDSYKQEYYKGHAEDMGDIVSLNETVKVPFGSYSGCLETRDWSTLDTKLNEYKYYCKDVGNLALEAVIDGGERTELIKVGHT